MTRFLPPALQSFHDWVLRDADLGDIRANQGVRTAMKKCRLSKGNGLMILGSAGFFMIEIIKT
ncbi:MAG: hypothetical protein AXA67_09415 [Methylothermaceae bacteria B42]|nr:MAG: hypothetical protein AXA67_09415 [Methylothermaceae bacteria B42]